MWIWITGWCHLLSAWGTFNISCMKSLLVKNSFNFCLPGNIFISPSLFKDIFAGYKILGWHFNFWHFSYIASLPSKYLVCEEMSDVNLNMVLFYMMGYFSFSAFKMFLFCVGFPHFYHNMFGWIFGIEVVLHRWESGREDKALQLACGYSLNQRWGWKTCCFFECSSCMRKHMEGNRQSLVFWIPSDVTRLPYEWAEIGLSESSILGFLGMG